MSDPLTVLGAPCTVFSSMQNINQKHHGTPEWQSKYEEACYFFSFLWTCIGIRLHEVNSF